MANSHQTVGSFIYEHILSTPNIKVRGKLIHTIERKFYKEELFQILEKQKEFIPELKNIELYKKCVHELYKNNEAHVESLMNEDFTNLFVNDIIFYQRPLKSKKSLIANCPFESYHYKDKMVTFNRTRLNVFPSPILFMKNSAFGNFCLICAFTRKM